MNLNELQMYICQEMHQTVVVESKRYKDEQGRMNYVTPTSYLELLSIFSKIFGQKKNELIQARKRTKTGLDKVKNLMTQKLKRLNKLKLYEIKKVIDYRKRSDQT